MKFNRFRIFFYYTPVFSLVLLLMLPALPLSAGTATVDYNEIARYLAGISRGISPHLVKKTGVRSWRKHCRFMDRTWKKIDKGTIRKITAWQVDHLPQKHPSGETVFYPLSGADFINMYALMGRSQRYMMIAMEKPGTVPAVLSMKPWQLRSALGKVRKSLYWYGAKNYFTTAGMKQNLSGRRGGGTLSLVMIFMVRMGLVIDSIDMVDIAGNGSIVHHKGKNHIGYRVLFHDPAVSKEKKELIYLGLRLSNESVTSQTPEGRLLVSRGKFRTLLKSAVYLMQMKEYAGLKNFILKKSSIIVQDDSGMAYREFDPDKWKIFLYGRYCPISIRGCRIRFQKDLADAYKKQAKPLPFIFGYGRLRGRNASNIMVMVRHNR